MRARTLIALLSGFLVTACVTPSTGRVVGHRLVYLEEPSTAQEEAQDTTQAEKPKAKPVFWIALTNISSDLLQNIEVSVTGMEDPLPKDEEERIQEAEWKPGEVWLARLGEFNCRIPLLVEVTYQYPDPKSGEMIKLPEPESVALSGVPTALPLSSLRECERFRRPEGPKPETE